MKDLQTQSSTISTQLDKDATDKADEFAYAFKSEKGLSKKVVEMISKFKDEPDWMLQNRLKALDIFLSKPMPTWGADLSKIDFDNIHYYVKPMEQKSEKTWEEVPPEIKKTYERLGIPQAEQQMLAGVGAQYDCVTGDTVVFANPKARPIKDLNVGDYVYALNEETKKFERQKVNAVVYKGERQVYKVTAAGRSIKVTENHPLYVIIEAKEEGIQEDRFQTKWRYLKDLKVGDSVAVSNAIPDYDPSDQLPEVAIPLDIKSHTSSELGFAPITEIETLGIEGVYDISVQGHHNFIAEGIVVHNSEMIYHSLKEDMAKQGVIFCDVETATKEHPDLVKQYFGRIIPAHDNKFAALNTAVWSGGSFIYVPKGVHVEIPLQAYFRINLENMGQFERTLIIADEGSYIHYIEGCLPAGEQISLGDKWVNIESVKPSDYVVTEKGKKSRVKAVMTRPYKGDMIKIKPLSGYNTFRLTPEHPVLGVSRDKVLVKRKARNGWLTEVDTEKLIASTPSYIPAGKLKVGDFIVFPKISAQKNKASFTTDQLRFLGYYLAEGYTFFHKTLKQPVVTLTFNEKETEYVEEVCSLIQKLTNKKAMITRQPKRHAVTVVVYSKSLMDFCVTHAGQGSKSKQLSEEIMGLPSSYIVPLLETYFNGDGNVSKKKGKKGIPHRVSTSSEQLARQLQELYARLDIYASIQIRKGGPDVIQGRPIHRSDQYILSYTSDKGWSEVRECEEYFLVPVKGITHEHYDGFVFNLEVKDVNSYLVRGFAVHNCSAPTYSSQSLHSAVVEIVVKKGARVRYTTIQNWATNIYNLVTKRMVVDEEGVGEWIDGNIGSCVTMKYPSVYLRGKGARGDILSLAVAGAGQQLDTGGKAIHLAPHTSSSIISKSISKDGGRSSYRGMVKVYPGMKGSKVNVRCDALILDAKSRSDTYPTMDIQEQDVEVGHEASVSKIGEDQLFYLQTRGLDKTASEGMIVNGFIEPIIKELPMEYAMELNNLIQMEMENSVG